MCSKTGFGSGIELRGLLVSVFVSSSLREFGSEWGYRKMSSE